MRYFEYVMSFLMVATVAVAAPVAVAVAAAVLDLLNRLLFNAECCCVVEVLSLAFFDIYYCYALPLVIIFNT